MIFKDILFYLRYYKNWIISLLIFTFVFVMSVLFCYAGSLYLLDTNKPLLVFLYDSISYTLIVYCVVTIVGCLLIGVMKIFGFFNMQDKEKLLKKKVSALRERLSDTSERFARSKRIIDECPMFVMSTFGNKVVFMNEIMQEFLGVKQEDLPRSIKKVINPDNGFSELRKKAVLALMKKPKFSGQIYLTDAFGEKKLFSVTAQQIKTKLPQKDLFWFFQDASLELKNIELEMYYQTVFRVMSVLHTAEESLTPEEDVLNHLLNEVIEIFGIKTGAYFRYRDKRLSYVFGVGEQRIYPKRLSELDLTDPSISQRAVVRAIFTKQGCVYNDLTKVPYYQQNFGKIGRQKQLLSAFAFPVVINGQVEGVVSLYGYNINVFTDNLVFRIQQLNAEICKNLASIRERRFADEAIKQYEKCLRTQIHELENNKKIMQRQACEVNAMVGDLIVARDAAESANKAKTDFLANVSHELRTPLNAILGFSEAIEKETFGPLENKQYKDYIGYITTSGRHLLSLINDVLDLARVEEGRHSITETNIKLKDMVHEVVSLIKRYPGGDTRKYKVTPHPIDVVLRADARSVKQILLNVLSNAVKFTEDNVGRIHIDVAPIKKNELVISITDNGIGVPANKMKDLFKPFVQVENAMTREHEGTGLGLALVQRLMELHGGRVWVKSKENKGTTVYMAFPAERVVTKKKKGK